MYASVNKDKKDENKNGIYSEVGFGGGRVGPRPVVEASLYAEAKNVRQHKPTPMNGNMQPHRPVPMNDNMLQHKPTPMNSKQRNHDQDNGSLVDDEEML